LIPGKWPVRKLLSSRLTGVKGNRANGSASILWLPRSQEGDISERDEEILAKEVDPHTGST
jgi:hypothetical protein